MPSTTAAPVAELHIEKPAFREADVRAPKVDRYGLQSLLLVVTVLTTTFIGMRYRYDFDLGQAPLTSQTDVMPYQWGLAHLGRFADGLPFSLTLIAILLAHEFGHYTACRFCGLRATLPFLFPAPTLSGTFGAVIHIKSRIRSRAALLLVGASGPIAGFCVAVATTCYGLIHSKAIAGSAVPSMIRIGAPEMMTVLRTMLIGAYPGIPQLERIVPHPVLTASWIGILITSINLIPAGQLDGGHILYALSPRIHGISHRLMLGALLYLGTTAWIGWLIWAFFLMMPSMRHPAIADRSPIRLRVWALAPVSLIVFGLTWSTQPSSGMSLIQVMRLFHWQFWVR